MTYYMKFIKSITILWMLCDIHILQIFFNLFLRGLESFRKLPKLPPTSVNGCVNTSIAQLVN